MFVVAPDEANKLLTAVPEWYSYPFDLARPIVLRLAPVPAFSTPRVAVAVLYRLTLLNASVSPDTKPISGEPYELVTFTKLPISNLVLKLLSVLNSLALSTSTYWVANFSTSKPFTYAFPGDKPTASLVVSPPVAAV